jgi:hypothetical protein
MEMWRNASAGKCRNILLWGFRKWEFGSWWWVGRVQGRVKDCGGLNKIDGFGERNEDNKGGLKTRDLTSKDKSGKRSFERFWWSRCSFKSKFRTFTSSGKDDESKTREQADKRQMCNPLSPPNQLKIQANFKQSFFPNYLKIQTPNWPSFHHMLQSQPIDLHHPQSTTPNHQTLFSFFPRTFPLFKSPDLEIFSALSPRGKWKWVRKLIVNWNTERGSPKIR